MNGSTKQKVTYATVGSSVICPHWCSILVVPEDDTLPSIKKFCALWIVFLEVGFVSVSLGVANVGCRGSKPARVLDRKICGWGIKTSWPVRESNSWFNQSAAFDAGSTWSSPVAPLEPEHFCWHLILNRSSGRWADSYSAGEENET